MINEREKWEFLVEDLGYCNDIISIQFVGMLMVIINIMKR